MFDFKKHIPEYVFIIFFSLIFFLEGFAIKGGRIFSYYLILFFPIISAICLFFNEKQLVFDKKIFKLGLIYLFLLFLSTMFAVNVQKSFEAFLLILSFFLIYLYISNLNKLFLEEKIVFFIKIISFLLSILFLIFNYFIKINWNVFFDTSSGYQYIFSPFGQHFHLGDLVLFPIFYYLYEYLEGKKIKSVLFFIFYLFIMFFSFSRSAYVSFLTTFILFFLKKSNFEKISKHKYIPILVFLTILFFIFTTFNLSNVPYVNSLQKNFSRKVDFGHDFSIGQRNLYFTQGLKSFLEKPLFGVGLDNFFWSSRKYGQSNEEIVTDSHNLPISVLSENGLFAFGIFCMFIFYFFKKSKKNIWFYLLLAGFINFQFDYSYKIYSFIVLFILIISFVWKETEVVSIKLIHYFYLALFLFFLLFLIFFGKITFNKNPSLSYTIYPLNLDANNYMLSTLISQKKYQNTLNIINRMNFIFKGDINVLENIGDLFAGFKNKKIAINFYKNACKNTKNYDCLLYFRKIYQLDNDFYQNDKELKSMLDSVINYYDLMGKNLSLFKSNTDVSKFYKTGEFMKFSRDLSRLCREVKNIKKCPSDFFYDDSGLVVSKTRKGFNSIQVAIDLAFPGDSIYVDEGVYKEFLDIQKPISLIGKGADKTILQIQNLSQNDQRSVIDISNLEGNVSIKNFNISSENNGQNNGINIKNLRKNGNVIISNNTISIYNPIRAVDTSNYKLFIYANTISGGNSNINIQNWFGEVEISNNLLSKTRKINGTGFVILIRNLTNNYLDNKQAIFSNTIDLGWENNTSLSRGFGIRFGDFKENNLINNWSGFSNIDIHNNNIINAKPHRHGIFIFNNSKPSEKLMKPTINISDNNIKGTLGGGGNGIILIDNVKEASLNSNIIEDMNKEMVIYSNLTDYFYQNSN